MSHEPVTRASDDKANKKLPRAIEQTTHADSTKQAQSGSTHIQSITEGTERETHRHSAQLHQVESRERALA